ncbi:MAG: beta-phosphoglucomutase [Saprospiraceae bacterium]|nr:beta-phosphoglucomutase [Saprospiraceae bacterium]
MSRKIQAFIFDLDGVIVDTAKYHFRSWQRLAYELGYALPEEANHRLKGLGRLESLQVVLEYHPGDLEASLHGHDLNALTDRKNDIYKAYISNLGPGELLPGVTAFLQQARTHDLKLAIGSGSRNARVVIEKLEIARLFDAICDGTDITRSKPDPEVFVCAATKMGLEPNGVVIFEDAASGIEAANRCGAFSVGVGDPALLNEADIVISGFDGVSVRRIIEQLKAHS